MSTPTFAELRATTPLSQLMRDHRKLHRHWDALVRVVLSISREPVDFEELELRELDAPVTAAALRAWLETKPGAAAMRWLSSLFLVRDPHGVTRAELVKLVTEVHPDGLPEVITSAGNDVLEQQLAQLPGEALGAALARRKLANPEATFQSQLEFATDEARGAYLRDAAAAIAPYEVRELGRWLAPRAASLAPWISQAWAEALAHSLRALTARTAADLWLFAELLDAASVERVLRAAAKRPAPVLRRAIALLVSQGQQQCVQGLVAVLDEAKLGRPAALGLASLGQRGVDALKTFLAAQGKKPSRGAPHAQAVVGLAVPRFTLWHGDHYRPPRFARDPRVDLLPSRAVPADAPRAEPTPLATLEAAVNEKPRRGLLSPEGWADLLQLVALDPHLADLPWAWQRAQELGRLGLGAHPAALQWALDEVSWGGVVTRHHPPGDVGVGHLLLWAGGDAALFRHAIARFELSLGPEVLGARTKHLGRVLEDERPAWAPPLQALLTHYGSRRGGAGTLGLPLLLAHLEQPAPQAELTAPGPDAWVQGTVKGAAAFSLELRGATLSVDVAAQQWKLSAPALAGATVPLDGREVTFLLEVAGDRMYFGLDDAVLHGAVGGLPKSEGPVRVTAAGDGALVTRLELFEKHLARGGEAAAQVFLSPDKAQSFTEVSGLGTPEAAHLLAAAAAVLDDEAATLAKAALGAMKGVGLEPWKALAPKPQPKPTAFTMRSFEDVVRDFQDARLGVKKSKKPAVLKRGQTESGALEYASFGKAPATEDWGSRAAVSAPAVYLSEEAPDLSNLRAFMDTVVDLPALSCKGRGASANVEYCVQEDQYLVASLELTRGGGDDLDGPQWFEVKAAAWKVDEGWALGLLEGTEEDLLKWIGMQALPARVEWKREAGVGVGDW